MHKEPNDRRRGGATRHACKDRPAGGTLAALRAGSGSQGWSGCRKTCLPYLKHLRPGTAGHGGPALPRRARKRGHLGSTAALQRISKRLTHQERISDTAIIALRAIAGHRSQRYDRRAFRSRNRRSCGRWDSRADTSARTRCGWIARRCGSRQRPLFWHEAFAFIERAQLGRRLEGAILVHRLGPGDVARPLSISWHHAGENSARRQPAAAAHTLPAPMLPRTASAEPQRRPYH
jgi:hypothetical protein